MKQQLVLPQLGFSIDQATVSEWLVDNGTMVEVGQAIYVLESDKSVQEIEAPIAGKITIQRKAGQSYPVGTVLAEIEVA